MQRKTMIGCAVGLALGLALPVSACAAEFDWSGFYFGGKLGYGWGTATDIGFDSTDISGIIGGGQLGYNFNVGNGVVLGVEGDINASDEHGTFTGFDTGFHWQNDWNASVRGRVGMDFNGILPYAEAGVAWARGGAAGFGSSDSATFSGWTAGGGVEVMLSRQASANFEYRYADYGKATILGDPTSLTGNIVAVGLNWHLK